MYNLNKSIEEWKTSLLFSESITEKDLMELESHLIDEIENLKEKGLSEKEAFWVARNRLGENDALDSEFRKSNIKWLYINRFSWIIYGWLLFQIIYMLGNIAYNSSYILMISNGFNALDSYAGAMASYYAIFSLPLVMGYLFYKYSNPDGSLLRIVLNKKSKTGLSAFLLIVLFVMGISYILYFLGNMQQEVSTAYYSVSGTSSWIKYAKYMVIINPIILITFLFFTLRYVNFRERKIKEAGI